MRAATEVSNKPDSPVPGAADQQNDPVPAVDDEFEGMGRKPVRGGRRFSIPAGMVVKQQPTQQPDSPGTSSSVSPRPTAGKRAPSADGGEGEQIPQALADELALRSEKFDFHKDADALKARRRGNSMIEMVPQNDADLGMGAAAAAAAASLVADTSLSAEAAAEAAAMEQSEETEAGVVKITKFVLRANGPGLGRFHVVILDLPFHRALLPFPHSRLGRAGVAFPAPTFT